MNDTERIKELEIENERLKSELSRRILDRNWFENIFDSIPNPLFIKDEKHRFVLINESFCDLISLPKSRIIGKTDNDLLDAKHAKEFWDVDAVVLAKGEVNWKEEELNVDGKVRSLLTSKTRIQDEYGKKYVLGIITEITNSTNQNVLLQKRNHQIEDQQRNIETLLKEVHHRVKNNLQVVSSLLNLQMDKIDDDELYGVFQNSRNRIVSMSRVHETLYQSNDFYHINFSDYLGGLLTDLSFAYDLSGKCVIEKEIEDVFISTEMAIPLGLIVNELVSNSFKHALNLDNLLKIQIKLSREANLVCLVISDNGKGFDTNDVDNQSLGLELVHLFVEELDAEFEMDSQIDLGSKFTIRFKC